MTRVRIGKNDKSQQSLDRKKRPVISESEFKEMLSRAEKIKNPFYRLRSIAILCVLKRTGKRRGELARLKKDNVTIESDKLQIRFTLEKKIRHFKVCHNCSEKNSAKALFCKKCGTNIEPDQVQTNRLETESLKSLFLSDPLAHHITDYLKFLESQKPTPLFFFPASRDIFGNAVVILQDEGIKGRQIYNLIHALNSELWPHLFRDTMGAEIVRADSSLYGLFRVMRRLDLENLETSTRYVRRFIGEVIEAPEGITA
jgi:integrase